MNKLLMDDIFIYWFFIIGPVSRGQLGTDFSVKVTVMGSTVN